MQHRAICKLGLSPCPNDTFIFHALLHGLVDFPLAELKPRLADVEALNQWVVQGEPEFSKISVGVVPHIMDNYALLASGSALGFKVGPLVVARKPLGMSELQQARVAVPGLHTTANMLLHLTGMFKGERKEMLFSDVMSAVSRGDVDAGVIIHEGRFTFAEHGLVKILDLGEWWEETFHLPLPLGVIAVRRDVDHDIAHAMQKAIAASLSYANKNPQASASFIRENAQELTPEVIQAHIKTFVTNYSLDLGEEGRAAITKLIQVAGLALPKEGLFLN